MLWLLSYIGSNFALILVVTLAVAALGAFAWFARNWKAAVAALALLAAGFTYMQIDKSVYQRRVAEEAASKVRVMEDRLRIMSAISKAYTDSYVVDQNALNELKRRASETPPNNAPCLDRDAARRVQSIR
jgi:apolipoprotein N-acyltransferase